MPALAWNFINWVDAGLRGRERRNQDPGEVVRVGTNPSERTNETVREHEERQWHVTGRGQEGGGELIIEFLGGFQPISRRVHNITVLE